MSLQDSSASKPEASTIDHQSNEPNANHGTNEAGLPLQIAPSAIGAHSNTTGVEKLEETTDTSTDITSELSLNPKEHDAEVFKSVDVESGHRQDQNTHPVYGESSSSNTSREDESQVQSSRKTSQPNVRDELYLDPTPKTPRQGVSPTRASPVEDVTDESGSTSEIQSIMEQFEINIQGTPHENSTPDEQLDGSLQVEGIGHPVRKSSLEPARSLQSGAPEDTRSKRGNDESQYESNVDEVPQGKMPSFVPPSRVSSLPQIGRLGSTEEKSLSSPQSLSKMPPAPDPEPDLPFDFHRFLEQLRHRTADPVAKYLRSFLIEFGRKQWMVHEQVKLISDFLSFITNKMARCEVWRGVSDAEFDNAKEGMEKLVMNRLYTQTFSPALPPPAPNMISKGKRKAPERSVEPGRKGQHQEDIERDEILGQKVRIYGWIQEEHLDIPRVSDSGRKFLTLAQQELLKIKTYRAPRDKIICVLNCCKVIFGILRNSKTSDTSADSFVPLLIYVVLHANPDHLVSNVQYILRFRNQDKLSGEAGYYLSSLMGAIQFIENLDRTSLTIGDEEFERNVEAAVSVIAEKHEDEPKQPRLQSHRPPSAPHISEKSGLSQPEVIPRNSIEAEYSSPRKSPSLRDPSGDSVGKYEEGTAVGGLLRTIQKPLSSIGRIFSEEPEKQPNLRQPEPPQLPQRLSPAVFQPPRASNEMNRPAVQTGQPAPGHVISAEQIRKLSAEDAAASQARAEAAEAQRIQSAEHQNIVETLAGMFPDLDREVIDDVVRQKQGRVGLAVDACLALNN